jgi:phytoene dehydrogenase-like protein
MSDNRTDQRHDVVVVGAGIAGLSAAVTAAGDGARVLLVDAHGGGGRARTTAHEGFALNEGPHALYLHGPLNDLLGRLSIEPPGGLPRSTVYGQRGSTISLLPLSATTLARSSLLSMRSKAKGASFLAKLAKLDTRALVGRSVDEWLGDVPPEVADIVRTLIRVATFVDAPHLLDAGAAATQLQLAQRGVRYVDGGWATIVDSLLRVARERGVEVVLDAGVSGVERGSDGPQVIVDGTAVDAASVVLAAGGPATADRLLAPAAGAVRGLAQLGPSAQVTVLDLGVTHEPVHPVVFGVDEPWYLSTHGPAAAGLAPRGQALVTVMRYLAPDSDGRSYADALADFARSTGIDDDDVVMRRYLHRMTANHGLPLASAGGLAGRPSIDATGVEGVFLAGDWVGDTGMLSDAAAASGQAAARAAVRRTAKAVV